MLIDCCDGSDEYDGSIICHNTCVMGGNVAYEARNYGTVTSKQGSAGADEKENGFHFKNSTQKLKGIILFLTALVQVTNIY